jgi:hypothetical protein
MGRGCSELSSSAEAVVTRLLAEPKLWGCQCLRLFSDAPACFLLVGLWLRLKAMEEKFDYLTQLLLAPPTEEYRQN